MSTRRYDRLWLEKSGDNRTPAQRDRDRVLYTSAFQRLAEVTQVVSPDEGHVFHNRLTHSLKVAQVARRIAERLVREDGKRAREIGGIDPDVVEAASLAHDLGHPPFGHIAEEELNNLATEHHLMEGFDGSAQSFRIVTKLALRSEDHLGLNLTRATLNAILKYPWTRGASGKKQKKWGAYSTEKSEFDFARELMKGSEDIKSAEADLMDLADDITYAVHDVADFYRAGLIPLHRLAGPNNVERERFYAEVFSRRKFEEYSAKQLCGAFDKLAQLMPFQLPYTGTTADRSYLRHYTAGLISTYVRTGVEILQRRPGETPRIQVNPETAMELTILKQLTWHYVLLNPSLATQQHGQRRVVRTLFEIFHEAADKPSEMAVFPLPFQELLRDAKEPEDKTRIVCDYIAGLTERQALDLHLKLTGVRPGSALH
jgi:dGTPase